MPRTCETSQKLVCQAGNGRGRESPRYGVVCVAEPGTREVNHERSEEALAAGPAIIAAGCPFCNTMLTDGVKHFNKEGEVVVKDVAELIAEAGDL